ncbi:MAG: tRNA preQ1(34) S-adenosylmethionine ribosyltransferase-isomerase QueA [Synergistales bacterium]
MNTNDTQTTRQVSPFDLLKTDSYDYDLPQEQIAQTPAQPRDASRLLVLRRNGGSLEHRTFRDLVDYLLPDDLLVLNDARVIPARLHGNKADGNARCEIFLLRSTDPGWREWEALVRPGRRLHPGTPVLLDGGALVEVGERLPDGLRKVFFPESIDVHEFIERAGQVPLPPYIRNDDIDPERYQTVYARREGAVAAPTAGLHFTEELLETIRSMGIEARRLTLHVGIGTFRPVKEADIRRHPMHEEFFEIPPETASRVNIARQEGRRIVAVGTTVVRALEAASPEGTCLPGINRTNLFIYPGYRFKMVDALVTNFHLPKSSLLMLVSAFAGHESTMQAYRTAVKERYRFFSFGDAMFII